MRKFGYILGDDKNGVIVLRENRVLISLKIQKNIQSHVYLRQTMFRLLEFLLEKGKSGLLLDEIIMKAVWEGYGLRSSAPRLWQVMHELRKKLDELGVEDNFILRVEGRGYIVNAASYEPVYIRASYDRLSRFVLARQQNTDTVKRLK
ncbi:transcriptional regulator [Enterobacter sp. KBR-315C3_2022]|uniref:winged helix-turn-helix domain-containing protein n=1 Tax=Enterobacter sp. KBR-315C3_2022 TaxID=3242494 RepID=UPI003527F667